MDTYPDINSCKTISLNEENGFFVMHGISITIEKLILEATGIIN